MSRIDLRRSFKQLFRTISQLYLSGRVVDEFVFIDAIMSMGLKYTCKLFEEDSIKTLMKGLLHHHPKLFSDRFCPLVGNYLDDIWFVAQGCDKFLNRGGTPTCEFFSSKLPTFQSQAANFSPM